MTVKLDLESLPRIAVEDMPAHRQAEYAHNLEQIARLSEEREQRGLPDDCRHVIAEEIARYDRRNLLLECRPPWPSTTPHALAHALRHAETANHPTKAARLHLRLAEALSAPIPLGEIHRAHTALDDAQSLDPIDSGPFAPVFSAALQFCEANAERIRDLADLHEALDGA